MADDFNITGTDKLLNYERLSPTFSVYKPLDLDYQQDPISIDQPTFTSNNYDFPELNDTEDSTVIPANIDKPKSFMDKFREMLQQKPLESKITPSKGVSSLADSIAKVESNGGNYKAYNPKGGGEGAVGKYQFRWTTWKPSISKITGITNKEDFMNDPQAQEDFFKYYHKTTLIPQLQLVKKEFPNSGMSDDNIMKLLHFRGIGNTSTGTGVRGLLTKGDFDNKRESYNLSPRQYLDSAK